MRSVESLLSDASRIAGREICFAQLEEYIRVLRRPNGLISWVTTFLTNQKPHLWNGDDPSVRAEFRFVWDLVDSYVRRNMAYFETTPSAFKKYPRKSGVPL